MIVLKIWGEFLSGEVSTGYQHHLRNSQRATLPSQRSRLVQQSRGDSLYLSVLVLREIRKGIEGLRSRDSRKANELDLWLEQLQTSFQSQILPVDIAISQEWGRLSSLHTVPVIDGLLAATATAHRLVLVTRNTQDFEDLGIQLLNPFEIRSLV